VNGRWQWTWAFRTPRFTLFHIDPTRSASVLQDVLGDEFSGTLGSDYYAAYLWHTPEQFADETKFRAALIAQGKQLERGATERAPDTRPSRRIARRFEQHAEHYLRFTHAPGLEPTNNAAEQAIRQVVIDRHVTQGTRSARGRAWCERIWTTIATCRQHGRDLLSFLEQSFLALLTDTPPPTLLAT